MPNIELVYDRDCPNVAQDRSHLLRAFAQARVTPRWSLHLQEEGPPHARGFGLADCCAGRGVSSEALRSAGLGQRMP